MSFWEATGQSDEWYTPKYIFDALGCRFDLDVAHPQSQTHVPYDDMLYERSLECRWHGFIWMNPPFGGRNSIAAWLAKFFEHGNGIALTPDRTSAPWWQEANHKADAVLFIAGKVKFEKPDGSIGKSPSNGTTLFAAGPKAVSALIAADRAGLGQAMSRSSRLFSRVAA
ncbi:adenine methyltransferase [Mesorhizobium sp. B2-1-3]|uniref:DNA N-6-adenine-methyltransferase n=1 Tax=Mesorhizobium sp. B2-1-3 TaxID=2589972 RepID=UPI00112C049E|nr:DNA N-6-adenine-methyltransferase [Mesorhizobium sp. B2-1-3]TPN03831.1 adenine methyltransferase [Mesorhizobium sp. B2-1-3]